MSEVRTLEASFALSGTTHVASFAASFKLSKPAQVASFSASAHLNHVKSFSASALITDKRGTFRGTMPTSDRDALPALQPQDTVLNIDAVTAPSGTSVPQLQAWTGSAWLSGKELAAPSSGVTNLWTVPTTAGWRVELGDPTYPLRFWDGTTRRFSVSNAGQVYGKTVLIENTTGSSVALSINQDNVGAANIQEWSQAGTLESWITGNGTFETVAALRVYQALGQAYPQADIDNGALSLGPGGAVSPDFALVWTATDVANINSGDSLQWGGSNLGRLDSGGFMELSAISAPSTPASNKVRLYDIGGVLKWKNSAGTIFDLSAFSTTTLATDVLWAALGDLVYGSANDTGAILSGNTTTTQKFLTQTGNGSVSAAPAWTDLFGTANVFTAKQKFSAGVVTQSAALATSATSGDLYVPTNAGTPTGVPATETGTVAMRYDTSANRLWIYNGAWKGVELA